MYEIVTQGFRKHVLILRWMMLLLVLITACSSDDDSDKNRESADQRDLDEDHVNLTQHVSVHGNKLSFDLPEDWVVEGNQGDILLISSQALYDYLSNEYFEDSLSIDIVNVLDNLTLAPEDTAESMPNLTDAVVGFITVYELRMDDPEESALADQPPDVIMERLLQVFQVQEYNEPVLFEQQGIDGAYTTIATKGEHSDIGLIELVTVYRFDTTMVRVNLGCFEADYDTLSPTLIAISKSIRYNPLATPPTYTPCPPTSTPTPLTPTNTGTPAPTVTRTPTSTHTPTPTATFTIIPTWTMYPTWTPTTTFTPSTAFTPTATWTPTADYAVT